MIVNCSLNEAELRQVAALHCLCLPDSMISLLGSSYSTEFYRYVSNSDSELLFVNKDEDRIAGVCVLSLDPSRLKKNLVSKTPFLRFFLFSLFKFPLVAIFIEKVFARERAATKKPELVLIYTDPERIGCGIGTQLVGEVEAFLREKGYDNYFVKTLDKSENLAVKFYEKNKFNLVEKNRELGKQYCVFQKRFS